MRRASRRESTRRHLFDTAVNLFRTNGYLETRVDEIIQAAGVAKGTFYVHFPTKDAILSDYAAQVAADLQPRMEHWLKIPPQEAIMSVYDTLNDYVERDRRFIWDVVRVELVGDPWDDGRPSALFSVFSPIVMRGQAEGVLRSDMPADAIVNHLLSNYLIGLAWILRHDWPFTETMRDVLQLTMEGITQAGFAPRRTDA